ncbi:hypothetical protein GE061_012284 [Apolygus lucorum]|uniref:Uncharacterized protein n=1 Tax=Apolygus lucorum TaxID=248454 RepID=A0A8S9XT76_APOLU|nr:hypothetical protein GE061_012284 [Apolygus lucorum]
MIVSRTLHPSYHSLKNHTMGGKLASTSLCCYSLALSGHKAAQLCRSYSSNLFPDSRSSKKNDYSYSKKPVNDIVNSYLNSLNSQTRKSGGSMRKFEPCYRPLYPSKKNQKPTYKIPRKLPYIPAVFQPRRKPILYRKQQKPPPQKHPVLNQWPALYKCKKRGADQQPKVTRPKTGDLPPWLLPLYSCKAGRPGDIPTIAEARFRGGAFHRRMNFLEDIKEIRQKQEAFRSRQNDNVIKKIHHNLPPAPKNITDVDNLKRMIGEMYAKKGWMRRNESFQRTQQLAKEPETAEKHSEDKLDKDKTHAPPSSNQGVTSKVASYSIQRPANLKEVDPHVEHPSETHGSYKSSESKTIGVSPRRMESVPQKTMVRDTISNSKENNATDSIEWSVNSLKSRINDMLANEEEKMNKITSKYDELVGARKYGSDGLKPKGNQPSSRSFHRISLKPAESKLNKYKICNRGIHATGSHARPIKGRLQLQKNSSGSYLVKRSLSSFIPLRGTERPTEDILPSYKSHDGEKELPEKKAKWITRIKRCFVIKRNKELKMVDWKHTPRKIPYCRKEDASYSPSPVLWTSKETSVAESQPESPEERTNPVVLNAEQRILASINRIEPTPVQKLRKIHSINDWPINNDLPDVEGNVKVASSDSRSADRLIEVEKKVRKAELKVGNLPLPWPNEVKTTDKIIKLPELSSSQNEKLSCVLTEIGKKEETGYEWIMNNKETVEDIKDRSRYIAGRPLVPSHVKQSIEEFKLPLRAQIAQYRKNIERKAHGLYFYSTSRRWYSTSSSIPSFPYSFFPANSHAKFLQKFNASVNSSRSFSCDAPQSNKCKTQREQPKQNTRSEVVGSEFYHKYALRPMYGDFSRDEPLNRLAKDPKYSKSWTNVTEKALPQKPAGSLTSPNKMLHVVGDTSPATLKKQVDDLKRLIRKSKGLDFVPEKIEPTSEPLRLNDNNYESKLRKLVRTAQVNARKLKVEPKYHTENNMLVGSSNTERKPITSQPLKVEPIKSQLQTNSSPDVFTNLENDSRIGRSIRKTKPQISSSVSVDSFPRKKSPFSNMYLRLKSFVESVRRKSTQENPNSARMLNNKLRGCVSMCALPDFRTIKDKAKEPVIAKEAKESVNNTDASTPLTVELRGGQAVTPVSSVHLWKTEPVGESDEPTPEEVENTKTVVSGEISKSGELMSLLTKAKELLNIQSELNAEEYAKYSELMERKTLFLPDPEVKREPFLVGNIDNGPKKILSPEEIMQSLLTKHVAPSKIEQIDATLSENKTKFWPVMSFLPQNVFGGSEENDSKAVFHQNNVKSIDGGSSSQPAPPNLETEDKSNDVQTPSVHCVAQEMQSSPVHEKPDDAKKTHVEVAGVDLVVQEPNPVCPSTESTTPIASSAHLPSASAALSSAEPEKRMAEKQHVMTNQNMTRPDDPKISVVRNVNLDEQDSESGSHSDCKDEDSSSQDSAFFIAEDIPTSEGSHPGKSVPNGVTPERWESFSKNLKNVLARHAVEVKRCEQEFPESPNEMSPCNNTIENVDSNPELNQNDFLTASRNFELQHEDILKVERQYNDTQESQMSSSPYNQNHELGDSSRIASNVTFQTPNELTSTVTYLPSEEAEVNVDNEMASHKSEKFAELLAKDPTIDPELVKKLKLPAAFSEECKEKTWCTCTPSRND